MRDPNALPERTMRFIDNLVTVARYTHPMNSHDCEDLQQHCYLAVIVAREQYDPRRKASLATFLEPVAVAAKNKFFRARARFKRSRVKLLLDQPIAPLGESEFNNDVDAYGSRIDVVSSSDQDPVRNAYDSKHAVEEFLLGIKDLRVRKACELLLVEGIRKKEVAARLGMKYGAYRYSVEPEAKKLIREFFGS